MARWFRRGDRRLAPGHRSGSGARGDEGLGQPAGGIDGSQDVNDRVEVRSHARDSQDGHVGEATTMAVRRDLELERGHRAAGAQGRDHRATRSAEAVAEEVPAANGLVAIPAQHLVRATAKQLGRPLVPEDDPVTAVRGEGRWVSGSQQIEDLGQTLWAQFCCHGGGLAQSLRAGPGVALHLEARVHLTCSARHLSNSSAIAPAGAARFNIFTPLTAPWAPMHGSPGCGATRVAFANPRLACVLLKGIHEGTPGSCASVVCS